MTSVNDTKVIRGVKLIGWQKSAVEIFKGLQPTEKFFILASRQKGKSLLMTQIILYVGINRSNSQSYMVSPTNLQNRARFKDLVSMVGGSPLIDKMNESTLEIRFTNGSRVTFLSAESGNLRGLTCSRGGLLIIDEAAFIKDDIITSILTPYVTVHRANMILVSTPRRKSGYFYDGYIDAVNGVKGYKYIDVSKFDNSFFITDEQIEDYRRKYTPERFKNEILGQFTDSSEGLFGDYQAVYNTPDDESPVYCGIDFSTTGTDYTAMCFFNKSHEMCRVWYDRNEKDPVKRVENMISVINSYPSLKHVVCETNSMGSVYISLLRKGVNHPNIIESFTTTNSSKKEIIEDLVKHISQKDITLLNDPLLDYQFSIFESVPLSKGNYTYAANTKVSDSHDDLVMATALAVHSFKTNTGQYKFSYI